MQEKEPPTFVRIMVFAEFVLFVCFGFVQAWGLFSKTRILNNNTPMEFHTFSEQTRRAIPITSSLQHGKPHRPLVYFKRIQLLYTPEDVGTNPPMPTSREERIMEIEMRCNYAYICLSFIAKTFLCWIVLSPILADTVH